MTPRLRDDLVAATVEEDGVLYVDLSDPTTGVSFRFYDFEYELAKQLNGQPVEAVVAWASLTYQTEMSTAALDEFVEKLAGLGFLVVPGVVAPVTEPPPSSPFTLSAQEVAASESIGVASGPMFEGLSGELFGDLPGGPGAPLIAAPGLTPAVSVEPSFGRPASPFVPVGPAPSSSPRAGAEVSAPEPTLRERSGGAPASKARTLTGVTLAPLTPMTAPGGTDTTASPPALPRLQSLGSPLPPLMAEVVKGGAEVKRSPPRPGSTAPSAAPPPIAVPAQKSQSSPWPLIPPFTSPPVAAPKSSSTAKSSSRAPVAPSPPPSDETPFASIAHAIVSEAELPRGWPSLGEALEHSGPTPAMGSIIPPEALAGGPESEHRAPEREKRKQPSASAAQPVKAAPSPSPLPSPVTPATSAPAAKAPPSPATPAASATPATSAPVAPAPPMTSPASAPAALAASTGGASAPAPMPAAPVGAAPVVATAVVPPAVLAVPPAAAEAPAPTPLAAATSAVGMAGPSRASPAWVAALTDEVERPAVVERRQPPPPEVVVMPPVEASAVPPVPKRRAPLVVGVVLLGAVVAGAVVANRQPASHLPVPSLTTPSVHVTTPQPTTMYEWFGTPGKVIPGRDDEVGFKVAGRLQDVMPPGTTFSAGEAVAHLQGSAGRELTVNRIRSRVAFFEQLRDSSRAAGNEAAARQAEANIAARKRELVDAQAKLSEMEIRPAMAGTIAEVLIQRGAPVRAGAPVFKIRAAGPRATFPFSAEEQAKARALGFCRVETVPGGPAGAGAGTGAGTAAGAAAPPAPPTSAPGGGPDAASAGTAGALAASEKPARIVDCALPATAAAGTAVPPPSTAPLAVDLPAAAGVSPGTVVRLASARFDGVFPIPRKAVVHGAAGTAAGGSDRVWVVSEATQAADSRAVELAPSNGEPALVTRGLAAGDMVIVDPPADLASGVQVNVLR